MKYKEAINGPYGSSDYTKEPVYCRSVDGSVVMLKGTPVMFQSGTQKYAALSVTEAELYAAVSTA